MISYIQLINKLKTFFESNMFVQRFESDFLEQFDNYSGQNEKYPMVFMSLDSSSTTDYLGEFTIQLHCLDVIQKDRANINNIISDTQLILQDLYRYLKDGDDTSIYVESSANYTPLNNAFCDYLAGNVMTLSIEVETQSLCELPLEDENLTGIWDGENDILTGNGNLLIYG